MPNRAETEPAEDRELTALLRRFPSPAPPPGLFERAVAYAVSSPAPGTGAAHARVRRRWPGVAAALAAAAIMVAVLLPRGDIPAVSVSLDTPETVRLVFAAEAPLEDATMTLTLPQGVELDGFPGERTVRWETSLAAGQNLLPLTLIATSPAGGDLLARLEHGSRDRTFRLHIDVG